jgi:muramoyltetrapeptide carboxypeptidase
MSRSLGFGLFAPAGAAIDLPALDRACALLAARGFEVVEDEAARARHQRFAGTDDARLAAVMRVASRPDVDVAVAIRGGYGWTRLLDRLDYGALARSGKRWMGHSDFTAFQLAMLARAGAVTYAGPMACADFGAQVPSAFTLSHCFALLEHRQHQVRLALQGPDLPAVRGTLWGGNLSMVAHLAGTPYLPRVEGGLLFLEDVAEHPYRIERLLYQLDYAGVLARQRAILLGAFTEYTLFPHDQGYDLAGVVEHLRARVAVPVYTGLPFGHVPDKLTLPVGAVASLRVRGGEADLVLGDR